MFAIAPSKIPSIADTASKATLSSAISSSVTENRAAGQTSMHRRRTAACIGPSMYRFSSSRRARCCRAVPAPPHTAVEEVIAGCEVVSGEHRLQTEEQQLNYPGTENEPRRFGRFSWH